eukprot:3077844-Pleurochrysis_carterae.AAC.3
MTRELSGTLFRPFGRISTEGLIYQSTQIIESGHIQVDICQARPADGLRRLGRNIAAMLEYEYLPFLWTIRVSLKCHVPARAGHLSPIANKRYVNATFSK